MDSVVALRRLVSFDTVSDKSNRALIDWVADYLDGLGARVAVKHHAGGKADLIATVGPDAPRGVILSGHTDVVPVAGQSWTSDPFTLTERDTRLVGRGSCDMKGFIAVALALVPELKTAGLARPLHFVLSFDEEIGCLGAPQLIERYRRDFPEAHAAIVGEPTHMRFANAHKGVSVFKTSVRGKPGHSSNPDAGVNAILIAADCIRFLMERAEEMKQGGDARFAPPHATVSLGQIDGGTASNIIAGACSFVWDCRSVSPTDAASLLARFEDHCGLELVPAMRAIAPEADISTERHANVPPLVADPDSRAEALARRLTGQNAAQVISFAAEAGLFQKAGIPCIVCGPGDIAQAHQPDEFVEREQLDACADFLRRLGSWLKDE
jgi:acetylornithine deacetylase